VSTDSTVLAGATSSSPATNNLGGVAVATPEMTRAVSSAVMAGTGLIEEEADVPDDRQSIEQDDRVLLIVEDDPRFARILLGLARERGFKGVVTGRGDTGVALARRFRPDAITLDLRLPELDGWKVLDLLKHDPATRHIPVHIISATDQRQRALELGAIAHLTKPVERQALAEALDRLTSFAARKLRRLLVVEDDETQRMAIVELIGNGDVETTPVASGTEALAALAAEHYDCVVLDLGLPDMTGVSLIERIRDATADAPVPIVIYTGKELTRREEAQLRRLAETIIIKDVRSPERLLDETALFLHRVEARLPEPKRRMLRELHRSDPVLTGRKVLIVDDDMRNIFALTSALERYQMDVTYAENGREGIEALKARPETDIVLMDIMMPELDGYETIRQIRATDGFGELPIIALTAKAMRGDRERCIEAGASDYITKPVDVEQLVSLLRVWLYR
jgi:CheY-like chemotaxis protein